MPDLNLFSASHPEHLPSFSISSSFVLLFVLLPSFSLTKKMEEKKRKKNWIDGNRIHGLRISAQMLYITELLSIPHISTQSTPLSSHCRQRCHGFGSRLHSSSLLPSGCSAFLFLVFYSSWRLLLSIFKWKAFTNWEKLEFSAVHSIFFPKLWFKKKSVSRSICLKFSGKTPCAIL